MSLQSNHASEEILLQSEGIASPIVGVGHDRLKQRLTRRESMTIAPEPVRDFSNAKDRLRHQISAFDRKRNHLGPRLSTSQEHDNLMQPSSSTQSKTCPEQKLNDSHVICFATHGCMGVLDLGASKTVIGSDHLADLMSSLSPEVRRTLSRGASHITFRFGNQGTLKSQHALIVPIGQFHLKISVVPGGTPFLLSNSLMRALEAQIDCRNHKLNSPFMQRPIQLQLTSKGLFLISLDDLATNAVVSSDNGAGDSSRFPIETFVSEETSVSRSPNTRFEETDSQHVTSRDNNYQTQTCEHPTETSSIHTDVSHVEPDCKCHQTPASPCDDATAARVVSDPDVSPSTRESDPCHVAEPASPSHAAVRAGDVHGPGSPRIGGALNGSHRLWIQAQGQELPGGLDRGPTMGDVDDQPLSGEHQTQPPEVHQVCGSQADPARRASRTDPSGQETSPSPGHRHPEVRVIGSQGKGPSKDNRPARHANPNGFRGRVAGERDVHPSDYELRSTSGRECDSPAVPHAEHGECVDPGDCLHREPGELPGQQPVSALLDVEAEVQTAMHHERKTLNQWIVQIGHEFDEQIKTCKPIGPKWLLGEVFCSQTSSLTQQVLNLGSKSFRFGYTEGDLATKEGRRSLFTKIAVHRPRNIWFSPTCGPWSSWSQLNATRSMQHWLDLQQNRCELLYQVALGIVLYRHQVSKGDHFHWEQPKKSLMLTQPGMNELHYGHTQTCDFDMCRAGELKDPTNHQYMKKGMNVITTSQTLYSTLHGLTCNHQHAHQPIEGSMKLPEGNMLRTTYTENYPRKFARMVAKSLQNMRQEKPFRWDPRIHVYSITKALIYETSTEPTLVTGPAKSAARRSGIRAALPMTHRDRFPKSELTRPEPGLNNTEKRRKLNGKQATEASRETCQHVMKQIENLVPRVGKVEITHEDIRRGLQIILTGKTIVRIMACRGTDRTLAPPKGMHADEAPYRRTIMYLRNTGEVNYETNWEKWDNLSQRQLIRPAHACRLNVTVFAKEPDRSGVTEASSSQPSQPLEMSETRPENTDTSSQESRASPPTESTMDRTPQVTAAPVQIDTTKNSEASSLSPGPSQEDTLRFQSLAPWERNMLKQMHVNLGHPNNDRLAKTLQGQGYRPEIVQAAKEMRCVTCAQCSPPKHPRPAALKPMLDFNAKIYIDGINWTNKAGTTMHLYHILDAGSNYHVAIASPSNTSANVIKLLQQHWCSWAGTPNEIVVDSGTELNSSEFQQYLQQYGIKATTTNPEAHWQSGRIERHGSFLQSMLTKIDVEMGINDYTSLQAALNQSTAAKNTLSQKHGYAPEVIVFGRHSRLPGSILNDEAIPSHLQALNEGAEMSTNEFRSMLALRETARRAYHAADNCDVLRRAILRRSCPNRGTYQKNEWIMIWRTPQIGNSQWIGPQRVIIQDADHTVWSTQCGKLYRSAPENVRRAMPEEGEPEGPALPEDITPIQRQIQALDRAVLTTPETSQEIPLSTNEPQIITTNNTNDTNEPESQPEVPRENSQVESIQQPDQEPDGNSQNTMSNPDSDQDEPELVNLLCHEPADALTSTAVDQIPCAWRCEFDITLPEGKEDLPQSEEESWLLLATSAKKQRSEVKLTELNQAERQEFDKAKQSEIANWIQTGTLTKVLRNQIPEDQILKRRWILTWKPLDPSDVTTLSNGQKKTHKAKARLVILGYLDPQIENIPRDSPTLNKTSRMLILQMLASMSWKVCSFDIKAAFLQGQPQSTRVMGLDPVPELRQAMSMGPNEVGKLNKGAYGLIDAPYLWYCALVQELTSLGFETSPFDPCLFILREPPESPQAGQLAGILGVHVDDGLGGGNQYYDQKIKLLEKKFPFGSKKMTNFTFTGVEISQQPDHSIVLNQSAYVRKITPIVIENNRKTQEDLQVNEKERLSLRGVIGSLQYAAINTRPDLSSRLSMLQSQINSATIGTLQEANKLLHEAKKHHDMTITIKPIPTKDFRFMAFSDASFSSASKPDSHAGMIIVGTHKDILQNYQCPISPISWGCRKIQKVVTSTLSAETMSLQSALDQLAWLRIFWSWILDKETPWKNPEKALEQLPPAISSPTLRDEPDVAVTDCKSLYDLTTRTAPPSCTEFRTQLVARAIKEALNEGISLRWVSSGAQLADALTKAMEAHFLRETLRHGSYRLSDIEATLKTRAKTRDRIKWLKEQHESHANKT